VKRAALALGIAAAIGCSCKRSAQTAVTGGGDFAVAVKRGGDDKRARERAALRQKAMQLVKRWTAAQNAGDANAYFALYDGAHFKGVKRTRAGATTFDFAGWKLDRTGMMASHPKVAAEPLDYDSWLEPGSKLKRGAVEVHFTQRWQSPHYADHGEKVLSLWRAQNGELRIVYEDLLNSEPGWAAPTATGTLALAPPSDAAAARAVWKSLAPTGADYAQKLASLPDDPSVRRPLARVLVGDGNFACTQTEETHECGEDHVEWKALDPAATVDDPCLRRKLALWALAPGVLTESDVETLMPSLRALFALPAPEDELPKAVMLLAASMSGRTRARLIDTAMENSRKELAEALCCSDMGHALIGTLYSRHHLDAAAAALDVATERAIVLAAVQDDALAVETRAAWVERLRDIAGKDVLAALGAVADGASDCGLTMAAASALAARGDASRLPRRRDGDDQARMARALCMLARDDDVVRRRARFREFLPPHGRVTLSHAINSDWDEAGNKIDESPAPSYVTRATAMASDLPDEYGAGPVPECGGDACSVPSSDGSWTIYFVEGKDGKLYVREINRLEEHYCPC
jgi:hypothetical protein